MKVLKACFFLGFSLLVIVFVFSSFSLAETLSRYDKEEYFPHKIGTRWVYEITTGDEEPTYCNPIFWTRKDGSESVQLMMRGILPGYKSYQKSYKLIISIDRSAYLPDFNLPSSWSIVQLDVEKDELGLFKTGNLLNDLNNVYWALNENHSYSEDFVVILLTTYNPRIISGSYSLYGDSSDNRKPYNKRVIFFAQDPDFVFTIGEDPKEDLGYVGVDGPELYFIRSVKTKDTKEFSLDFYKAENQSFTEHMWFAKGKGLTRLVQRRDEKTTMVWKLTEFSQGY